MVTSKLYFMNLYLDEKKKIVLINNIANKIIITVDAKSSFEFSPTSLGKFTRINKEHDQIFVTLIFLNLTPHKTIGHKIQYDQNSNKYCLENSNSVT